MIPSDSTKTRLNFTIAIAIFGAVAEMGSSSAASVDPLLGNWGMARVRVSTDGNCGRATLYEWRLFLGPHPNPDGLTSVGTLTRNRLELLALGPPSACAQVGGAVSWDVAGKWDGEALPLRAFFGECTLGQCADYPTGEMQVSVSQGPRNLLKLSGLKNERGDTYLRRDFAFSLSSADQSAVAAAMRTFYADAHERSTRLASLKTGQAAQMWFDATWQALDGIKERIVRADRIVTLDDGTDGIMESAEVRGRQATSYAAEFVVFQRVNDGLRLSEYVIAPYSSVTTEFPSH